MYTLKILFPIQPVQWGWGGVGADFFHGGSFANYIRIPGLRVCIHLSLSTMGNNKQFSSDYPQWEIPSTPAWLLYQFEYLPEGWVFNYNYPQQETPSNLALTTHSGKCQANRHDSCTHLNILLKGGNVSIITHSGKRQAIRAGIHL